MSSLERITAAFSAAQQEHRAALMPYFTLGFPNRTTSKDVVKAIAGAGADLIELGVPFSDPLADGPSIQHSTQAALEQGITTMDCLEMVKELRQEGITQPFFFMGYANPIMAFGVEAYAQAACQAGVDGLIVPDLPMSEAGELESVCVRLRMALVYLVAPTTTDERLAQVARHSTGFLYIVSLTGVTGARSQVSAGLDPFLKRVRAVTDQRLAVGFGISTPAQAAQVGRLADGIIVGSRLIDVVEQATEPVEAARHFVCSLREALEEGK